MKKLKPVKVTPLGNWYRVKTPAEINENLLNLVDWPEDKPYLSVVFPKRKIDPAKPLRFRFSRKHTVSMHCLSAGKSLKTPLEPSSFAGILARPPKNIAELKKLNRLDYRKVLKEEGKRAGYSVRNEYNKYEKEIIPGAKALLFYKKGKFAGLVVHFKSEIFQVGMRDHLGWHSDFKEFTPAERRSAEYQMALWLKKTARRGLSVLMVPVPDAYYRFIAGLGMVAVRVRLERL